MKGTQSPTVTLLITTYNWERALELVLASVERQSHPPDEVIVADDGSKQATADVIEKAQQTHHIPIRHLWHPDEGFRRSRILNTGIAAAKGDYIIQLDGDMVLHKHFVADHLRYARVGTFLQGMRLRMTEKGTQRLLNGGRPRFGWFADAYYRDNDDKRTYHFGRRHHSLRIPWLARIKLGRPGHPMGCNVSYWRNDVININGYDERMIGYGSEDLEFDVRMRNSGLQRCQLKFAGLALHLEHADALGSDPSDPNLPNNKLLYATEDKHLIRCQHGIDEHLNKHKAEH